MRQKIKIHFVPSALIKCAVLKNKICPKKIAGTAVENLPGAKNGSVAGQTSIIAALPAVRAGSEPRGR